jgi:tRNA (guanine-N7-)-methyltransferase
MNENPRYNETYYQFTQFKSRIINLRDNSETMFSELDRPIAWRTFFGNDNPVEIEVGCGKGRFLLEASQKHPERNYVGIERAPKYVRRTRERLLKHHAKTTLIVWSDAPYFVNDYLTDNSVQAYHIYFPDPWPKKRQRKRRIFRNDPFLQGMTRTLKSDGGRIHVATDYAEYFDEIHAKMTHTPPLVHLSPDTPDIEHIPTNFEIKYINEGRQIYRAVYEVREASSERRSVVN